ncbi:hypothetical protein OLMES_3300 [Oleiphilus messinensis]|uniref:Uncharacterized protein n=2 Tax=Oleiphilus messinensis TaxID=141451 RepID=A0A1Y0IA47_9GAMM|nr:hypothetical protein OLMES_3300 [Oleiphilus messinensis]
MSLEFSIDGKRYVCEAQYSLNSPIKTINLDDELEKVLLNNLGEAKRLNKILWQIVNGEVIKYPIIIDL